MEEGSKSPNAAHGGAWLLVHTAEERAQKPLSPDRLAASSARSERPRQRGFPIVSDWLGENLSSAEFFGAFQC